MTNTELKNKIENISAELRADITKYVEENAKFKVGDVIKSLLNFNDKDIYFVIRQVGYDHHGIVYYGSKIVKSTGEVSFQDMNSNIGTPEYVIVKATLTVKKKEISFIKEHRYFNYEIKINISI